MKILSIVLTVLVLSMAMVYAAEDTPFGSLDQQTKAKAEQVKKAAMKPLQMVLYIIAGLGGIIGAVMLGITGLGWMRAKSPTDRVEYEDRLKNIAIGTFLVIFGPMIIAALV
jgi:uncharacterized membrane protein YjgN (DUF898 family)